MTKRTFPLTCNQTHWLAIFVSLPLTIIGWNGLINNSDLFYFIPVIIGTVVFGISSIMKLIFYIEDNWQCRCNKK